MQIKRQVCFLHFPKTAGTALATQLTNRLGKRLIVAEWTDAENVSFDSVEWVHGHVHYAQVQDHFSKRPYLFTMLRHPFERVLSHYRFLQRTPTLALHDRVSTMTFEEFAEQRIGADVYVDQLTSTIDRTGDEPRIVHEGSALERLPLALERLRSFDLVTLSEQFHYSSLLVAADLGIEPTWQVSHANSAPTRTTRDDISEAAMAALNESLAAELEIYQLGEELFKRRVRSLVGVSR